MEELIDIDEAYKNLSNAIIKQAVNEYMRTKDKCKISALESFFLSDWCYLLSRGCFDGEKLIKDLKERKRKNEVNK